MTPLGITIEGRGLGAAAAAASLWCSGYAVNLPQLESEHGGPVLLLNEKTLWMVRGLFGPQVLDEICSVGTPITHRKLAWGTECIETLPEGSVSIRAAHLASAMLANVGQRSGPTEISAFARGRSANAGRATHHLQAFIWDFSEPGGVRYDWCATISVGRCWGALVPAPEGGLCLQVYIPSVVVAKETEVAADLLCRLGLDPGAMLDAVPKQIDASARLGTLWDATGYRVGDEALALDPLAGDGVGHTIRAALWVGTLLRARELTESQRQQIYRRRMTAAFTQHEAVSARYYHLLERAMTVSNQLAITKKK